MDIRKFCWRGPYEFSDTSGFLEYVEHLGKRMFKQFYIVNLNFSSQTLLYSFVFMLETPTQASSQEGASKVYELLQGKAFRSIGWSTLFECLAIYDEKFKQSLQTAGAMLPEIQEGDAKALVAYLNVLTKV